jgi:hypothetical protein
VHLELGVAIAAVLEAKSLELVVAGRQHHRVSLKVAPRVARGVLRAVDANEGPEAVVGVHAECEHSTWSRQEQQVSLHTRTKKLYGMQHLPMLLRKGIRMWNAMCSLFAVQLGAMHAQIAWFDRAAAV